MDANSQYTVTVYPPEQAVCHYIRASRVCSANYDVSAAAVVEERTFQLLLLALCDLDDVDREEDR